MVKLSNCCLFVKWVKKSSPAQEVQYVQETLKEQETEIMACDQYCQTLQPFLQEYLQLSKKIGGLVAEHADMVNRAFQAQTDFLRTAENHSEPAQGELVEILKPTDQQIQAIQSFREKNRSSPYFNHLSAVSESIPALGWVAVKPTPAPFIKEMIDAGQFYTNRVLKDWKEKDKIHVTWVKTWLELLTNLQQFVKQKHTTGLVWSSKGARAPPPPPMGNMPPPPPMDFNLGQLSDGGDDRAALFAQINQGEDITKSLKKVTSEMQTHKNAALRTGPAPFKLAKSSNGSALANAPVVKPPVFTKDGKKWLIEYQKDNRDLVVDQVEMNNVVYMFKCENSSLVVRGKLNSLVLDSCKKTAVVFDSLVASVEFINCQSVQMQVLGKVPTISVDKTDGCQMYLSKESMDVEIISSKSTELNILVPNDNGDYTEHPVPEQFKTTVSPGGINTTIVENKG